MTTTYRSTAIAAADRCPAAVDYVRTGAKAPRHVVATGVAAHAYLQARTERPEGDALTTATATARSLIAEGRQFDGVAEGGYPPTAVWAGINLAHEWEDAAPAYLKGSKAEVRILGRPDWRLTDNPSEARWSATIDNMATADDWLTAYEYKTSWPAGREWLSGPQAKVQTCLLWALVESDPRLRGLILTMVNLRTGQAHEREYARADAPEVKRMRDELTITAEALDRLMSPNRGPGHGPRGAAEATRPRVRWVSVVGAMRAGSPGRHGAIRMGSHVGGGAGNGAAGAPPGYRDRRRRPRRPAGGVGRRVRRRGQAARPAGCGDDRGGAHPRARPGGPRRVAVGTQHRRRHRRRAPSVRREVAGGGLHRPGGGSEQDAATQRMEERGMSDEGETA